MTLLNLFPHPSIALHIPVRREEKCDPVDPFAHPADADGEMKIFEHRVHVYAIQRNGDELRYKITFAVTGADNCVEPYS